MLLHRPTFHATVRRDAPVVSCTIGACSLDSSVTDRSPNVNCWMRNDVPLSTMKYRTSPAASAPSSLMVTGVADGPPVVDTSMRVLWPASVAA
jgi:hypothetical protein